MSAGQLEAILMALAGGVTGYQRASEAKEDRENKLIDRKARAADLADREQARRIRAMSTQIDMNKEGVYSADQIPASDQTDYSAVAGAATSMAGGQGIGLPQARTPNPSVYTGQVGKGLDGEPLYYAPSLSTEGRKLTAESAKRARTIAQTMTLKGPDGPLTRAQAELIADGKATVENFTRERAPGANDPRVREERQADARELIGLRATIEDRQRNEAVAREKPGQELTRKNAVADAAIQAAIGQAGAGADAETILRLAEQAALATDDVRGWRGKGGSGFNRANLYAAHARHSDKFRARDKAGTGGTSEAAILEQVMGTPARGPVAAAAPAQGGSVSQTGAQSSGKGVAPDAMLQDALKRHGNDFKKAAADLRAQGYR